MLWAERRLLELLLFKLEEEQLILSSGRSQWLAKASREVETVLTEIRAADLGRAAESQAAAIAVGLDPSARLGEIADAAPPPWDDLLRAHRDAFAELTTKISSVADGNRDLLASSHRATQETIATLHREAATYTSVGRSAAPSQAGNFLDRAF
jgi:hypothetical protein